MQDMVIIKTCSDEIEVFWVPKEEFDRIKNIVDNINLMKEAPPRVEKYHRVVFLQTWCYEDAEMLNGTKRIMFLPSE